MIRVVNLLLVSQGFGGRRELQRRPKATPESCSKILVLDETTAAVDVGTNSFIQRTIPEGFKSFTVLVIAHRLNTIIDCDRILVLDAGQVVEHDAPYKLLNRETGVFSKMVQSTGPTKADYLRGLALQSKTSRMEWEENGCSDRDKTAWLASSFWTMAANYALAVILSSNIDEDNIVSRTRDEIVTLCVVLEGKHNDDIDRSLDQ